MFSFQGHGSPVKHNLTIRLMNGNQTVANDQVFIFHVGDFFSIFLIIVVCKCCAVGPLIMT